MEKVEMQVIARIKSDFSTKFGIPRQSGLVKELQATIIMEPEFRNPDMLRGLDGFSHLWLIWQFSANADKTWSPTVRPPRLGGNSRLGVFATRSTFRPNFIGLSSVKLEGLDQTKDAAGGFTDTADSYLLEVDFPKELLCKLPEDKQLAAIGVLSHDPRPSYQKDSERIYGISFAGFDIRFQVKKDRLTVIEVI